MFIKLLKYDLWYGKIVYIAFIACMIAIFAITALPSHAISGNIVTRPRNIALVYVYGIFFGVFTVQAIFFLKQTMFSDTGYLMLTLPVSRWQMFWSKVLVLIIWIHLMIIVLTVGTFVSEFPANHVNHNIGLSYFAHPSFADRHWGDPFPFAVSGSIWTFVMYLPLAILAAAVIFFGITFSRSVFGRWQMNAGIALAVTAGLFVAIIIGYGFLFGLLSEDYVVQQTTYVSPGYQHSWSMNIRRPLLGIEIGALLTGEERDTRFIDLSFPLLTAPLTALIGAATYYLLKKRISL